MNFLDYLLVIPPHSNLRMLRTGWTLLLLLIILTALSLFLMYWFQNEIQFRLQAEAALRLRFVQQQVEGVLAQGVLLLQKYTENQLRSHSFTLSSAEFNSFFPDWFVHSKAAQEEPSLIVELTHQSSGEPLVFEALFRFHSYSLSDIPWLDLNPQSLPQTFPANLIFSRKQDQLLSLKPPRFSLFPITNSNSFHYVFPDKARLVWGQDQFMVFQGEHSWDLANFSKEQLHIQIQGDASIEGTMALHQDKQIFVQVLGHLNLELPNQSENFRPEPSRLFVHVTESMNLHSSEPSNATLQMNGFFWIQNSCPVLPSFLNAVYWKGSLACPVEPSMHSTVPLHFLYSVPAAPPPDSFMRTSLQFNGIRLLQQ